VEIEILNPSMYIRIDEHSPELCRLVNDMYADACRQSPERFAFANLLLNNINDALAELDRVLALPGFVGALITSNVGGKYLHTPEFIPFWDEVARRRTPVFMHPKPPPGYQDDDIAPLLAFPADTTLSTMKLLYSGLFERCPDLILILAHLGGTLPFLARRIDLGFEDPHFSDKYRQIPHRPSDYMQKLYFDTALGWHKPAFDCAQALVGIEHLVYGSDHFMLDSPFMHRTNTFLDSLALSKSDKEKIYSGNALRFLRL
jgi:predicted TIM-barrel fold metal-dependent hydrolase